MRYIIISLITLFAFAQCKYFHKKNTYSNLPADSAQYMMWCDELADDSNNAELLYKRGEFLFKKKLFVKALSDLTRATTLDTSKADYFLLLGEICFAVNKTKIAAVAYERAIALDREDYKAYVQLGELYYIVKEHALSLKNYDEAIRLHPDCEECYFYKGLNFREMDKRPNHNEDAISMFQRSISINPNNYDAYIQLGEIYDTKDPKIAIEYYNGALRIYPKSVESLYHRAYNYQMHNNYDSAGADYKRIIQIDPNYVDAYFNVAFMNMQQKRWKQAIEGYKVVTKMDNNNAGAWYNLGFCYEKNGEIPKAKQAYNECLMADKDYVNASDRLKKLK